MPATQVAIIDSGGANIASLEFALERLDADCKLTGDPDVIRNASHVILPGVGAAADAMQRLTALELTEVIPSLSQPVLGVCLGMQLLARASEEDSAACLDILPLEATRLHGSADCPVPHMGWSRIERVATHPLLDGIPDGSYFYFLHSYALPESEYTVATASHGRTLSAVLAHRNFVAAQFHPERSSTAGSRLLQNFLALGS